MNKTEWNKSTKKVPKKEWKVIEMHYNSQNEIDSCVWDKEVSFRAILLAKNKKWHEQSRNWKSPSRALPLL